MASSTPSRPPSAEDAMKLAAQWWYWQRHDDRDKRPDAVLPFHLIDLAAHPRRSRRMTRTLDGWPTFLALILLVALVYAAPDATLKWAALAGLAFLSLVTLPVGGRRS